jgi:hypothetical protein
MRLAVASGRSPKRILAEWDSEELTWLLAFSRVHPFGDDWRQTAKLCQTIMGSVGTRTELHNFMPVDPPKMDPLDQLRAIADL